MTELSEVIGSDTCAELLGCTPEQVEELAREGEIPGFKIGRPWRFVRADLLAYLAQKARDEAELRRAKRQPNVKPMVLRSKRQTPPVLPTVAAPGQRP